jgi:ubiquinone/menaquinone biosynthesis C-methylase UbiE
MTERLPFRDKRYDAVMSNVAAHMFSDEVTRRLLAEVKRVLRCGGLLLLHVAAFSRTGPSRRSRTWRSLNSATGKPFKRVWRVVATTESARS